ncbi:DUF1707 SHOCT-like domain-containing protein [Tessaracoccus caeni]|uniref:DUF1707 SHOCT-like domain-containing protein n=1 Tax=Tessaracoccus caeni TaxID=3031239 RepID=UPI0023DCB226|nr:DUF1707 domain-containing protein [Tessaracoccus caeni]MDF1489249.1 DUF1707 domain-containing protein [Tessaracoccus caeni]
MNDPGSIRVSDGERDDAVDKLREHAAAGRLSSEEFSDRMGKALEARTRAELNELFFDLPALEGPAYPVPVEARPPHPAAVPDYLAYSVVPQKTFWQQWWWMIVIAVVAFGVMRGNIIPVMIVIALGYTLLRPRMDAKPDPNAPVKYLGYGEQEEITALIRAGRKIEAIKRYREFTGTDLRTAKQSVELWERQLGS